MKIVFFGTSEFAMASLRGILGSRHKVLALVTQPDAKRGRDLKIAPPPTKVLAQARGIPVYQPVDASSAESAKYLKALGADLFVVVSFGQILKKEMLLIPKLYAINLHGSVLPKYRGAAPTNWAIINGDKTSGVSIIKMNERMDEGDILLTSCTDIDSEDTNITLSEKLSGLGSKALLEALDLIENGKTVFLEQDNAKATYAPKLKKEDALIDWNEDASVIHNKVRGFLPWPGTYTYYNGKILKVLMTDISSVPIPKNCRFGEVLDILKGEGIIVRAGSGALTIKELQLEGKNILDADSFLRGHRIPRGHILGSHPA